MDANQKEKEKIMAICSVCTAKSVDAIAFKKPPILIFLTHARYNDRIRFPLPQ